MPSVPLKNVSNILFFIAFQSVPQGMTGWFIFIRLEIGIRRVSSVGSVYDDRASECIESPKHILKFPNIAGPVMVF